MEALTPVFDFIEAHGAISIILQTAILLMIRSFVVQIPSIFMKGTANKDPVKMAKHGESFWFFVYYSFVFTAGIVYLWDKDWLWDTRKYWLDEPLSVPDFPVGLQLIYITQTAFYIGASIVILFLSHARANHKDKLIMLAHHFVTVMLLAVSFAFGQHRIGSVVLILHDVSDIFLEGSKLCRYSGFESVTNMGFAIFALVFFVSRLIVFPIRVLYATFMYYPNTIVYSVSECNIVTGQCIAPYFSLAVPTFWLTLLGTLQCLHVYWFALIFRMVIRAISERQIEKDIRSDDEEVTLDEPKSPKKNGKHKRD